MSDEITVYSTFPAGPLLRPLRQLAECLGIDVVYSLRQPAPLSGDACPAGRIWLVRAQDWLGDDPGSGRAAELFEAHVEALRADVLGARAAVALCPSPPRSVPEVRRWEEELAARLRGIPGLTVLTQSDVLAAGATPDTCYRPETGVEPLYTNGFHLSLAIAVSRVVDRWTRPPFKVVAVDADYTLWEGACAETPPGALRVGPGRARFHEALLRLRRQGMLLCLVTKNDPRDVSAAFAGIPSPLSMADFVTVAAGWEPKSTLLAAVAADLDLDLASFVYLDDNPAECAEVRAAAPEVLTVRFPQRDEDVAGLLAHLWPFDTAFDAAFGVTDEDAHRTERYRTDVIRRQARAGARDHAAFVASLELEVTVREATAADGPRVRQLADRVTQFVTNRPGRVMAGGPETCLVVEVSDRYGDYGLTGVAVVSRDGDALLVSAFLLSCRVLLRDVEYAVFRRLADRAEAEGLTSVRFPFTATERNRPARAFLESLSATWSVTADGSSVAEVSVRAAPSATGAAPATAAPPSPPSPTSPPTAAPSLSRPHAGSRRRRNEFLSTIAECPGDTTELRALLRTESTEHVDTTKTTGLWVSALCALWEDTLEVPAVRPDSDLFGELGATSVDALLVSDGLRRTLGTTLSLAEMLSRPTVRDQARGLMAEAGTPVPTVTRVRRGEGVPIVLFASAGGLAYSYLELVRRFDGDRDVLIAQAPELTAEDGRLLDLAELVSTYLAELEPIVSAGPVVLGGWSFGAILAWEVARAVAASGTTVPALLLFEPPSRDAGPPRPTGTRAEPLQRFFELLDPHRADAASLAEIDRELFPDLPPADGDDAAEVYGRLLDRLLTRTPGARRERILLPELTTGMVLQAARVWKKNLALTAAYVPDAGDLPEPVERVYVFRGEPAGEPHVFTGALPARAEERHYPLRPVGGLRAHSAMMERPNVDLFAADVSEAIRGPGFGGERGKP